MPLLIVADPSLLKETSVMLRLLSVSIRRIVAVKDDDDAFGRVVE